MQVTQILDGRSRRFAGGRNAVHMVGDGLRHSDTHRVERTGGSRRADGDELRGSAGARRRRQCTGTGTGPEGLAFS